jgi:hypothetical protein
VPQDIRSKHPEFTEKPVQSGRFCMAKAAIFLRIKNLLSQIQYITSVARIVIELK